MTQKPSVKPVRVAEGLLAGTVGNDPTVRVFKGVPFAAPPVGALRWRPPQPLASWSGVRDATHFGSSAVQADTGPFGPWTKEFIFSNAVSEDCLYLNIWTTTASKRAKLPVLVYIHGGAFTGGSGEVAVYKGESLAKKGLVVVTLNYRLGALGFLAHPELTQESEHHTSGNYGLLDQVAALHWIQKNIAAFGGDPKRVTIAGQSAGAMSVHLLMLSPLAKGLFHRAIAQSGSLAGAQSVRTRASAEQEGLVFAKEKGALTLAALRALSAQALLVPGTTPVRFGPVRDSWLLPETPTLQSDVPLLTGINGDEGSASPRYAALSASEKDKQRASGLAALTATAQSHLVVARAKTFLYHFTHAIPWPEHPEFGAFHTGEVPYVFQNLAALKRPWESVDRTLADQVSSYWVNFATSGDPNGKGLPHWPAFEAESAQLQRLDSSIGPFSTR